MWNKEAVSILEHFTLMVNDQALLDKWYLTNSQAESIPIENRLNKILVGAN